MWLIIVANWNFHGESKVKKNDTSFPIAYKWCDYISDITESSRTCGDWKGRKSGQIWVMSSSSIDPIKPYQLSRSQWKKVSTYLVGFLKHSMKNAVVRFQISTCATGNEKREPREYTIHSIAIVAWCLPVKRGHNSILLTRRHQMKEDCVKVTHCVVTESLIVLKNHVPVPFLMLL